MGIVENMSGFICPHCSECTNIFSSGGGKALSEQLDLTYLGNVPIDPQFVELVELQNEQENKKLIELYDDCELKPILNGIVDKILDKNLPSRI